MKTTRILFVDDEPLVLQGLQRMLRPMREEWEMQFLASGEQALASMAEKPFDVVVSDMRMPGMNGAQLLNEVMKRHPRCVRLILSGQSDRNLIMRCVGSTHQFLAKPCDPDALKATVRRAATLERSIQSDCVKTLAARMTRIPSVPSLYLEIVDLLQDEDVFVDDVGRLVAKDPGMTAYILKLVNSAFFGLPQQISNAVEATTYLGLDTIKTLVLSIHAFSQFENARAGSLSIPALWEHSLRAAATAKAVARELKAGPKIADEAYVAGMLHDVGKLVLAANFADQYQDVSFRMRTEALDAATAETRVFGSDHGDVGGYLLGLWGLPVPVVEAIALHHKPGFSSSREVGPLTALHIANLALRPEPEPAPGLDRDYLRETGLDLPLDHWRNLILAKAH
jgi:putative nucleotidyltransferase with HDIG domain